MPSLEISLPQVPRETRAALAEQLTAAFCGTTGHPAEIFGIRFHEYTLSQASCAGKLCDEPGVEPYLHLLLYCPRLPRRVKQQLGPALSDAFTRATGQPRWQPTIHLCEHPYDNIAVGGKLLPDAIPELADRKFYFDLPRD